MINPAETLPELSERLSKKDAHRRVWAYLRVSSEKQEANESLPAQEADIRRYCVEKGLAEPGIVTEIGSAAKPMFTMNLPGTPQEEQEKVACPRPKLLMLISFLKEWGYGHLVVWKLDRLSRVASEQELLFTQLWPAGIHIHSAQPGEQSILAGGFTNDPVRVLLRQVLGAMGQYERACIDLRLKMGLNYKAARGGWTGGMPPFGYKAERGDLVINPFEAEIIRMVYHLRFEQGMALPKMAEYLEANKHPDDPNHYYRQKLSRILANEHVYRGRYKDCFGTYHDRPDLKILPDPPQE